MLLLVDYSSMLYRGFHATPSTIPMNGVHGCLGMLARVIADRRPSALALAVDDDWRPQFRVDALPSYKAHRVAEDPDADDPVAPQEALGRVLLEAIGLAVVGAPGYEAEDVIATLAAATDEPVEILSGDRDLFALVEDPHVCVLYPQKGVRELARVDEAWITARYGIPGRAYGDYALLRGDPSDGLPGVAGIGEKTAASLIARYGSLEALLAATDLAPAVARKIEAGRDYLDAARRVVMPVATCALTSHAPLALPTRVADPATVRALAAEHRLGNAVDRLLGALGL